MAKKIKFIDVSHIEGFKENEQIYGHVYKVINLRNQKMHIGHCTQIIGSDNQINYLGGGVCLRRAVKKYGKDNFKKEIIRICYSRPAMLNWEFIYKKIYNTFTPNGYDVLKQCESISPMKDPAIVAKARRNTIIVTGEEHHCHGKRFKWINDGERQKQHPIESPLEEGWRWGCVKYNITEESSKNKSKLMKERIINDPLFLIKAKNNRKNEPFQWITNGVEDKRLFEGESIKRGWRKGRSKTNHSEESRERQSKMMSGNSLRKGSGGENNPNFGKPVPDKIKLKMIKSQKDRMWITNGVDNKRIKKRSRIPKGWTRGRKL